MVMTTSGTQRPSCDRPRDMAVSMFLQLDFKVHLPSLKPHKFVRLAGPNLCNTVSGQRVTQTSSSTSFILSSAQQVPIP